MADVTGNSDAVSPSSAPQPPFLPVDEPSPPPKDDETITRETIAQQNHLASPDPDNTSSPRARPKFMRQSSTLVIDEEIYEFASEKSSLLTKTMYSMQRDVLNVYGSFKSLLYHTWGLESIVVMLLACLSTTFFCYYTENAKYLAAKLGNFYSF